MILASDYERIINCTWPNSFKDFTNLKKKANSVVVFNCRSFPDMLKYRDHWWDLLTIWGKRFLNDTMKAYFCHRHTLFETMTMRFSNLRFSRFKTFVTMLSGTSNSQRYHWISKLLLHLKNQRSGSKTVCGFSIILTLKGIRCFRVKECSWRVQVFWWTKI